MRIKGKKIYSNEILPLKSKLQAESRLQLHPGKKEAAQGLRSWLRLS